MLRSDVVIEGGHDTITVGSIKAPNHLKGNIIIDGGLGNDTISITDSFVSSGGGKITLTVGTGSDTFCFQ